MKRLPRSVDGLRDLRAARWVRESTERQTDRFGPDAQREQQDRALERYGLVDTGRLWQVAHSGRTIASTAQFAEMLAAAGGEYDVLLVGYVSRFARDLRTAVNARHELHLAGAALLFCDERVLSSDEDAWEHWAREAVEAEAYSRRLAKRISEGYAAKFRRLGDQGGQAPLGFRRVGGERRLEIDPDAIALPVTAFVRYATGALSYAEIGAELGLEAGAVREILRNPVYNGWVRRYRRSALEERKPAPWRPDPPVSDELWERVEQLRERRTRSSGPRSADRPRQLLAGVLHCACGARIRAYGARRGVPLVAHPGDCPDWGDQLTRPADDFARPIARQLTGIELDDVDVAALVALLSAPAPPPRGPRPGIDRRRRELALAHADGRLTDTEYLAARRELDHEQEQPAAVDRIDAAEVIRWVRALPDLWRLSDPDQRRELVGLVYERIVVADGTFVEAIPTAYAMARGLPALLPERVDGGTGEPRRIRPTSFNHAVRIPVRGAREMRAALRRLRSA